MKKQLFSCLLSLLPMVLMADVVEIDGLYYQLVQKTKEAEVVKNPNKYSGNINIPDSVKFEDIYYHVVAIGSLAFESCYDLKSVKIPSSVKTINSYAFSWSGMKEVILSDGLTTIGEGAFNSCASITKIKLPQGLTSIGKMAFDNCQNLCEINIPNSVTSLGMDVFDGCWRLESIDIPNSITKIPLGAFFKCKSLKSVVIPNSIISIDSSAFGECEELSSVYISDIEAWYNINFSGVYSNPLSYGAHLYLNNEEITELIIPSSVQEIKANAFAGSRIEKVTVPDNVSLIGECAFVGCDKLKTITLGNIINTIGQKAFAYCINISDVYCYAEEPTTIYLKSNVFEGSYIDYATLHVPASSVEKYKVTAPWSEFKEVVAITNSDTGINKALEYKSTNQVFYNIKGKKMNQMQKGINIVRMSNGKTKKVVVK